MVTELPHLDVETFLRIGEQIMHSPLLYLLLALIFLDFATGMGKAFLTGKYSSKIGLDGVVKHSMILLFVIVLKFFTGVFDFNWLGHVTTLLLSFNYLISVVENLEASGVYFPPVVKEKFLQMQEKAENEFVIEGKDELIVRKNEGRKGVDR